MRGESTGALRRDAIGLREVLFQSVTAMAPAAAVAASIPAGAAFAGGSLPLAVLIALVACLFTASCVAELARELPAAGSVATYAARGLHPAVGFLVGWGYVFVEMLVPRCCSCNWASRWREHCTTSGPRTRRICGGRTPSRERP